jgi:hypothetical protein
MSILLNDDNNSIIQGFSPSSIVSVVGDYDVTNVTAVRVAFPSEYKINNTGVVGTMSGVTVIARGVTLLNFPNTTIIEVM